MNDNAQQDQININKDVNHPNSGIPVSEGVTAQQSNHIAQTANNSSTATKSQDSTNLALINWLGCLFFGFIPPLIIMLVKKDDPYVQSQAKEALNWSITFVLGYIGLWIIAMILGFILAFIFAPLAIIPMIFVFLFAFSHLVFCVMGAIQCAAGKDFRVPFNIRLIK